MYKRWFRQWNKNNNRKLFDFKMTKNTLKVAKILFTNKLKFNINYPTKNQHLQSFLSFTDLADRLERV
jgi:hypothetical protein